ncbi:ribokinase [Galbitalea sp. SE-J8]|uniref:ribokinase n=1 Tax=Galbitalea sp. SE-J8 TaxID=3054952 RepID=UPI00259D1107|nr:ribokinase [Galbitalea sp. SE-J8]MDM4761837.1 ribokinase [Galbitalea sp. SE-J8]
MSSTPVAGSDDPAIVVVGSINADLTVRVPRLPEPGETLTGTDFRIAWGGKGANQAAAAAALGARTLLVGAVGDDENGAGSLADLRERGVDISFVEIGGEHTGVAVIQVDAAAENTIAIVAGANATVSAELVSDALARIEGTAVVVSNLEVPDAAVERAAEDAERRGWAFVLNPAPARPLSAELVARTTVITPNATEFDVLGGADVLGAAQAIVVTRGADGCDIRVGDALTRVPAASARPVDTTGAGDAFTAGLAVALLEGRPLDDAVRFAAASGAIATEGPGARGARLTRAAVEARLGES